MVDAHSSRCFCLAALRWGLISLRPAALFLDSAMNFRTKHLERPGGWEHGRSIQSSSPCSALTSWVASSLCFVSVLSSAEEGAPGRLCLPRRPGRWEFRVRVCAVGAEMCVAHRRGPVVDSPPCGTRWLFLGLMGMAHPPALTQVVFGPFVGVRPLFLNSPDWFFHLGLPYKILWYGPSKEMRVRAAIGG